MANMKVIINGVELKNPIITASGTFGFGSEYEEYFDVSKLGGISTKGLTILPKDGNDGRRIHEISSGLMNSIGLQNPGVPHFIENELEKMKKMNTAILANLGGGSLDQYLEGAELLDKTDVDFIELNISCPNVTCGGMAFGIKSDTAKWAVSEVRKVTSKPLMVKLSPNAENIVDMAVTCAEAGADSLSLVNTFKGLAIDIYNRKAIFNNITAGVSGSCIKPIALSMVKEVCDAVDIPVIGMGGITTASDAIEFIMAGSHAIQIGSANFIKPDISMDILEGVEKFMDEQGIKSLDEIRGII